VNRRLATPREIDPDAAAGSSHPRPYLVLRYGPESSERVGPRLARAGRAELRKVKSKKQKAET
jgi:hypothetical protein